MKLLKKIKEKMIIIYQIFNNISDFIKYIICIEFYKIIYFIKIKIILIFIKINIIHFKLNF